MLQVGKVYLTEGKLRFLILAKKTRPSSNGYDYIAENLKTGLITFFNHKGEHSVNKAWFLNNDNFKWCGVFSEGEIAAQGFVMNHALEDEFPGYLRMTNDDPMTITYVTRAGLLATYA